MSNPFYPKNPMQMFGQFRQNPIVALKQAGYTVPTNIQSPQAMIQHLLSSGQITQNQVNNAQAMAQRMGVRF